MWPGRGKPYASVVIPVYNGASTIEACLKAITQQSYPGSYEIIVVDDGSTDETSALVQQLKKVRLIEQANHGPAVARNRGAEQALGEIVVFMDADCVARKNFLAEMLKPFDNKEVDGVQGSYESRQKELVARVTQLEIEERYRKMRKQKRIDHIGSYAAAYRRKLFLGEGGFDESFPKASGEDTEFSYRLAGKGHTLLFNPNAIVQHTHPSSLGRYWKVNFVRGFYRIGVYRKHTVKLLDDSYSSRILKLQVIFFLPTLLAWGFFFYAQSSAVGLSQLRGIGAAVGVGSIIVMLPMVRFMVSNIGRDAAAAFSYLGIGLVRVAALSLGIWTGLLKGGNRE